MIKKIKIFILLFVIISTKVSAQKNLEFNRVIFLQLSGSTTIITDNFGQVYDIDTIVVPVNRVLKIESVSACIETGNYSANAKLTLNNNVISHNFSTSPDLSVDATFPIWLPVGTYVVKLYGSSVSGTAARGYISAIEFNIIQ